MEVGGVRICCQVLQNTYAGQMRIGELEQRGDLYANRQKKKAFGQDDLTWCPDLSNPVRTCNVPQEITHLRSSDVNLQLASSS